MGKQIRKQKKSSIVAGGFFRFALYVIVAIVVIYIGKSAYDFGYDIFYQQPVDSEEEGRDITVVVDEGDSVYQVGRTLESRGRSAGDGKEAGKICSFAGLPPISE